MPETLTYFSLSVSQTNFFASFDILLVVLHSISGHCKGPEAVASRTQKSSGSVSQIPVNLSTQPYLQFNNEILL